MGGVQQPAAASLMPFFCRIGATAPKTYDVAAVSKWISAGTDERLELKAEGAKLEKQHRLGDITAKQLAAQKVGLAARDRAIQEAMRVLEGYAKDGKIDDKERNSIQKALSGGLKQCGQV